MSTPQSERLYNLLPALYRRRDAAEGEKLRALLAVMEHELVRIEADIGTLYENWFIETCEDWAIPYIADLLGIEGLTDSSQKLFSPRSRVGNSIAYRRRKGVAGVLESLARDLTGWDARVVEFFEHVATTQHVQHVCPGKGATFDIRRAQVVEQLGTPFDAASHMADVRRIASGRGRHNLGNVGLFVWRLQSYWLDRCQARRGESEPEGRYYLHPVGVDMPLFNYPQPQPDPAQTAQAIHLPVRLRREELGRELNQRREALTDGRVPGELFFGRHPAFQLFLGDDDEPVPSEEIAIGDLSGEEDGAWPDELSDHLFSDFPVRPASGGGQPVMKSIRAVVDPELGRLILAEPGTSKKVYASYAYAFSADMGGGPYSRHQTLMTPEPDSWRAVVDSRRKPDGRSGSEDGLHRFESLADALKEWRKTEPAKAIIRIADNSIYNVDKKVELAGRQHLVIEAADGMRPCVRGDLSIEAAGPDVHLTLNGLLINGGMKVTFEERLNLSLAHCTVIGPFVMNHTVGKVGSASLSISDSVVSSITVTDSVETLTVLDSIVGDNIKFPGADTILERVTIRGEVDVKRLRATDVIFLHPLTVQNLQEGSVRTSYVPEGSQTPQRDRCQPDLALADLAENETEDAKNHIRQRLAPIFSTTKYGQPGYAQLSQACAEEIRSGAEDHSEMGAFQRLYQTHHEANLRNHLADYLPVGLEVGIHFET